jgi:peptidoglycan hydrolase CwlO-like protein
MQRKRPDYDPDALRENIKLLDTNITRIQQTIDNLRQRNDLLKQNILKNNEDIRIFDGEIRKLENQKVELRRLIAEIEMKRNS